MSIVYRILLGALVATIAFTLGACDHADVKAEAARLSVGTPLAHDPTDEFTIGPWWTDGKHLLNLRPDGGYSIFGGNNRYSRPVDRGRWGQQNYATIWLEPYTGLQPQRIRVAITRIDGRLALQPPKYGEMFAVATPPPMVEDRLLGQWRGTMGSLTFASDATYQFAPASGAIGDDGRILAGHGGRWTLAGERITLAPSTPSVSQISLRIRSAATTNTTTAPDQAGASTEAVELVLEGLGGELVKVKASQA